MKTQNSMSQKIRILHEINKKGYFKQKCQASEKYVHLNAFFMNYCINAAWHGGNQLVALLRSNGSPGCFDSTLRVICIVVSGVSHLPLDNTP